MKNYFTQETSEQLARQVFRNLCNLRERRRSPFDRTRPIRSRGSKNRPIRPSSPTDHRIFRRPSIRPIRCKTECKRRSPEDRDFLMRLRLVREDPWMKGFLDIRASCTRREER